VSRTRHPHPATAARLAVALGTALLAATAVVVTTVVTPAVAGVATGPTAGRTAGRTVGRSVAVPAVPTGLPTGIEDLAPYVRQVSCDPTPKAGTLALGRLLTTTYPGTGYVIGHDCGSESIASEHADGRGVDWIVSARSVTQKAQAQALLDWLFDADATGRAYANARRMGVMYVIWNDHIWGAWKPLDGWSGYSTCTSHPEAAADTVCHRNRLHISLSWDGATGRDSFWSRSVSAPDYGPCRPKDLNWAPAWTAPNRRPCADYPVLNPVAGAGAVLTDLVRYSGATVGPRDSGPVVSAVQRALGVPADGDYGPFTADAVAAFQRVHALPPGGAMDAGTWRTLLAAYAVQLPVDAVKSPGNPLTRYVGTVLRYGDSGPAVLALQKALKITRSGWFGPVTRTAVVALQVRVRLPATGTVDAAVWRALGA